MTVHLRYWHADQAQQLSPCVQQCSRDFSQCGPVKRMPFTRTPKSGIILWQLFLLLSKNFVIERRPQGSLGAALRRRGARGRRRRADPAVLLDIRRVLDEDRFAYCTSRHENIYRHGYDGDVEGDVDGYEGDARGGKFFLRRPTWQVSYASKASSTIASKGRCS